MCVGGVCDGTSGIGSRTHGGRGRRAPAPCSRGHDIGTGPGARTHRAAAREGREADGGGARAGDRDVLGEQVVAAIRAAGAQGSGGSSGSGGQGEHFACGGRGSRCQGGSERAGHAPAQHAHDGVGSGHLGVQRRSHLARTRSQAAPQAHVQAVQRPAVRGQVLGRGGAVPGSAGEVDGPVLRREDADPGAGNARSRGCRSASATFAPKRTTTTGTARSRCLRR